MRHAYIYILGILLLLVIGFFVYYYFSDWISDQKEKEGFQAGTPEVFQLWEQRCHGGNARYRKAYAPSVKKSTAMSICKAVGARLATYSELNNAVKDGLTIPNFLPGLIFESDAGYISNGTKLKGVTSLDYSIGFFNGSNYVNQGDDSSVCRASTNSRFAGTEFVLIDLDGYSVKITAPPTSEYCAGVIQTGTNLEKLGPALTPPSTEFYGYPVCYGVKPAGTSLQIRFPTMAGKGWSYADDKIPADTDPVAFIKKYNITAKGTTAAKDTTICNTALTLNSTVYNIGDAALPNINITETLPAATASTYNIIDLNKVYTQVDIAKVDFPKRRDEVRTNEAANITATGAIVVTPTKDDLLTTVGGETKRIRNGYQMIMQEAEANTSAFSRLQSSLADTFKTIIPYYDPLGTLALANTNKKMTSTQYTNILLDNIDNYYQKLQYAFEIHPIAFLRKGVINFPSMINVMKVYSFPSPTRDPPHRNGGINQDAYWMIDGKQRKYACVDGLTTKWFSRIEGTHAEEGWWCYGDKNIPCNDGIHEYWGWAGKCIRRYWPSYTDISDEDYMMATQLKQESYDLKGPRYSRKIDSTWVAVKDATTNPANPIPIPTGSPSRAITVIGTMSQANMDEINKSINLAVCLNFTDSSSVESQIRISSENMYLYMSADASALPEYTNTIDTTTKQSVLSAANAGYNAVHCSIAITQEYFYLLPHHTRNMVNRWATARYNRVQRGLSESIAAVGAGSSPPATVAPWTSGSGGTAGGGAAFLKPSTGYVGRVSPEGSFKETTITDEVRKAFLDKVAQFYYEREQSDMGSAGTRGGQAIIRRFIDVFQIGNTVFDVRFEEYRKRGISFLEKLADLHSEYKRYSAMNLSREDQIQLEQTYLKSKKDLYIKDAQNVWASAQDCGVKARYVTIRSSSSFFISQIMIIDSAGQNVAMSATIDNDISPTNIYYSSDNDNPEKKVYYDSATGDVLTSSSSTTLEKVKEVSRAAKRAEAQGYLMDGVYTPRWYPSAYRTTGASTPLVFDLGSNVNIAAVRIILANNTESTNTYTVSLTMVDPNTGSAGSAGLETYQGVAGTPTDANPKIIIFRFAGEGDDKDICTVTQYDRFQVARIYTDYTPTNTAAPWTIKGYSRGVEAALTFDPKYNAGISVDMTINKGNYMYLPRTIFNLNTGGAAPPLNCNDPERIKAIFNEYNVLVDSEEFRGAAIRTALNEPGWKFWATTIQKYKQNSTDSTCSYIWTDSATSTDSMPTSTTRTRKGTFHYPYDTENWNADERTLNLASTSIENLGSQATNDFITLTPAVSIAVPYIKSTTLDTAGGFCPGLPCSDTQVMQSLLDTYNSQIGSSLGSASPAITKVHKAVTPTPYECEYLVETSSGGSTNSGSPALRKVHMYVKTSAPQTILYPDGSYNTQCVWQAPTSIQTTAGTIPGIKWDIAPNLIDSTPRLTRVYNYAYDIMLKFSDNVTEVVGNLVGLGSAQLDPSGSGIVNALVKYRTDSAAAAGEIRYFDDTDEMGNKCAPSTGPDGLYNSANFPKCRSEPIINSLYEYYRGYNPLSKPSTTVSRITSVLHAGLTELGQCDYTFNLNDYTLGATGATQTNSSTSGLRCNVQRIPFSCKYKVTECSYINPTPTVAEITAIPNKFVQAMQYGSGSGSGSAPVPIYNYSSGSGIGSDGPKPITAAGLNSTAAGTGVTITKPNNTDVILNSIDKVDCTSDYAKVSLGLTKTANLTTTSLIQCSSGIAGRSDPQFYKSPGSLMYKTDTNVTFGTTTGTLTAVTGTVSIAAAQPLLPYTIVGTGTMISTGVYEYRITTEDTLPFSSTYIQATFYMNGTPGVLQLAKLVPATPATSQNTFFYLTQTTSAADTLAPTLAAKFIEYWNGLFTNNKSVGNKIGTISGYYIDRLTDTIVFRATSATFGSIGTFDVRKYYGTAYYTVGFRTRFSGGTTFIYSIQPLFRGSSLFSSSDSTSGSPLPTDIITTSQFSSQFRTIAASGDGSNYLVQSPQAIMATNKYRSFRFKVSSIYNSTYNRAEITRIFFYKGTSTTSGGTTTTKYTRVDARNATVSVDGVPASYVLPLGSKVCKSADYTLAIEPTSGAEYCRATEITYPHVLDTPCGIGYINKNDGFCRSTGFFQNVLNDDLLYTSVYIPRLRLAQNQYLYIDFGEIIDISAYSFVLGSHETRPVGWILQGSINNTDDWKDIHTQGSYTYPTTDRTIKIGDASIKSLAFYNPGVFDFNSASSPATATQVLDYSSQKPRIKEGFKQSEKPVRRMRSLRWKIQETQLPLAPYVHATRLQLHTMAGPIPADTIRVSNPQGTRRSPADGPDKLLGAAGRWVDYNKSEVLITLRLDALPANPIYGFQFAVPPGIPNAIDYFPARWLLEGSYDGHTWVPLHVKSDRARIMGDASPIYKFTQEI